MNQNIIPSVSGSTVSQSEVTASTPTGKSIVICYNLTVMNDPSPSCLGIFKQLSLLDRLLTPLILICMVVGVIIGEFVPNVQTAFDTVRFQSVSVRKSTHQVLCRMGELNDNSYRNWPPGHDVAYSNQSGIRSTSKTVPNSSTVHPYSLLPLPQLDSGAVDYAGFSMGHTT